MVLSGYKEWSHALEIFYKVMPKSDSILLINNIKVNFKKKSFRKSEKVGSNLLSLENNDLLKQNH